MMRDLKPLLSRLPPPPISVLAGLLMVLVVAAVGFKVPNAATATLGYTSIGGRTDSGDSYFIKVSRFAMGATGGTVSSMSVYVAGPLGATPNNLNQLAIYTDNSDAPGSLIASSGNVTLAGNAWNTVPITASLNANTYYWLVYNTNGRSASINNTMYSAGSGQSAYTTTVEPFGTWPASLGPATKGDAQFSLFATSTLTASPTPTPSPTATLTATPSRTATPTPKPSHTPHQARPRCKPPRRPRHPPPHRP